MTSPAVMAAERARQLCRAIRVDVEEIRERLLELYTGRAWEALGYGSWSELCAEEFGTAVGALLPRSERRELVGQLTDDGMSTRAIGSALGVDQKTIVNDRQAGEESSSPAPVTGLDGKMYRPPSPEAQRRAEAHRARRAAFEPFRALLSPTVKTFIDGVDDLIADPDWSRLDEVADRTPIDSRALVLERLRAVQAASSKAIAALDKPTLRRIQ